MTRSAFTHSGSGALCRHTNEPSVPLTDDQIRTIAKMQLDPASGLYSEEDQAALAMYLSDIAGELLAYRQAARISPAQGYLNRKARAGKGRIRRIMGTICPTVSA